MSKFPVARPPSFTWHMNSLNTHFGAPRAGGFPIHGACDLVVPAGTEVVAVREGRIIRKYPFVTYCAGTKHETTTWAIDVAHDLFMLRYGEISSALPEGLKPGSTVTEGQVIALVGVQCGNSMLHLEMFDDPKRLDYLTTTPNPTYLYVPQGDYRRRSDLLDPTRHLDLWYGEMPTMWKDFSLPY